jgi:hypothetical protein
MSVSLHPLEPALVNRDAQVTHNERMHPRMHVLAADLQRVFGTRLRSIVAYDSADDPVDGPEGRATLALVERLTFQDLAACAPLTTGWRKAGLAVPLLLAHDEFLWTLDVFPIEYGIIIARHEVVFGDNPFAGMQVRESDLRRACELQAKSHLIHLREGYLESGGQPAAVGRLMSASAASLKTLAAHLERLDPGIDDRAGLTTELVREIEGAAASGIAEPSALFARYLTAVERLWEQVDRWRA